MIWIVTSEQSLARSLSGRVAGATVFTIGATPETTRASLQDALARLPRPAWVLHTGTAAAAQPGVPAGTLLFDVWGQDAEARDTAKAVAAELGFPYQLGRIVSGSSPRERALAVDLENDAVRDWCREQSLPFLAVESVVEELEPAHFPVLLRVWNRQRRALRRLNQFLPVYVPKLPVAVAR